MRALSTAATVVARNMNKNLKLFVAAERGRAAGRGDRFPRAANRRRRAARSCALVVVARRAPRHTCLAPVCISLTYRLLHIILNETVPDYYLTESLVARTRDNFKTGSAQASYSSEQPTCFFTTYYSAVGICCGQCSHSTHTHAM